MLIVIHSAPANVEKRTAIRATWGSESIISVNSTLRLLFLFGRADNEDEQLQLLQEQGLYGDMLQGNFRDAYFNLSYKHVMALKWFDNHCHTAQLLLKVDDDIYVNTPLLLQRQPALLYQRQPRELLLCARQDNARVLRSYSSKWRVSFREYADRFYPPFCPGFAVVYSANVVHRLYGAAQRSSFFRLDDVFVTGLLAKRCNISITDLTSYVLYPQELQTLLSVGSVGAQQREFLVTWHKMSAQQIKELWLLDGKNNASKLMKSIERARAAKSLNSL
ncbi:beta-1,3-galactosyltransferase 5-like [Drosophila sulfurigaster albostrigata]|uniref:beta-1,3-galactosyltransferase 5-like n=1 Tax=Drosophila sulfurigaster albostrigata TaxID=89887 RepID=UPI002D21E07A|nr:beta-1,3-galactosyltransferase 5-like [Drosophila sulfurigaster albostrigata]